MKKRYIKAKKIKCKIYIKKYSRDFEGELTDQEMMRLLEISQVTYYRYKKELREEVYGK